MRNVYEATILTQHHPPHCRAPTSSSIILGRCLSIRLDLAVWAECISKYLIRHVPTSSEYVTILSFSVRQILLFLITCNRSSTAI
jgi:hypothetical protein